MPAPRDHLRPWAAAFAAFSLTACASVDGFGDRALAYNDAIASAQNRMLFLNIVRAAYKHPMAFTSISGATGSATVSGSFGLGLPFAANAALSPFSAAPQIGLSGGPAFTIANLDTQEFMKGVLAPVGVQTIDLFGQEGLPWQELYDLFVGEVAIVDDKGRERGRLYNTPSNWGPHAEQERRFQAFLAVLHSARMRTEAVESLTPVGPPVGAKDVGSAETLMKLDEAKLTAKALGGGLFQLQKVSTTYRFCLGDPGATLAFETEAGSVSVPVSAGMRCGATSAARGAGGWRLDFDLRSAEGVTYYLGEVMRQELCLNTREACAPGASPIMVQGDGARDPVEPLLVATRGAAGRDDLVAVRYMGESFSLRGGPEDRSAQVLTILGQLVNLNKSAKDTPAPSVVTLVGH